MTVVSAFDRAPVARRAIGFFRGRSTTRDQQTSSAPRSCVPPAALVDRLSRLLGRNFGDALRRLYALHARRGHLGHQHQRGLGLRDRELRLVDRDRQRRHADLLAAAADAAVVARLDQSVRGGDDAFRRRDRRTCSRSSISGARSISTGSRPIRRRCRSGRNGAARSSGTSGRSPAISSFRSSSGMSASCPTLRRCATVPRGAWQRIYGVFALGWRGSARHWRHYHKLQITLAALATPLVCSVHSIVGLDFAASLMPGWREPIFPPYFVVGAMYSGFAVVVLLAVVISRDMGLQALITPRHFEAMAKIMLMASIVMGRQLRQRVVRRLVWRQSGRSRPRRVRIHRRLREALLRDAVLQRRRAADPVAALDAHEPSGLDRRVGRRS